VTILLGLMSDGNVCGLCGRVMKLGVTESWVNSDGEEMELHLPKDVSALLKTSDREIEVCARCYPDRVEREFSGADLAEIHYEFGLGHLSRRNSSAAAECIRRALPLKSTSLYLAALACAVDSREESDRLKREALALDPDCETARRNLERDWFGGRPDLFELSTEFKAVAAVTTVASCD